MASVKAQPARQADRLQVSDVSVEGSGDVESEWAAGTEPVGKHYPSLAPPARQPPPNHL